MTAPRYHPNTHPLPHHPIPNFALELHSSLSRLTTQYPPVQTCSTGWTFSGLFSGPTSIALLFHTLSLLYPPSSDGAGVFLDQHYADWAAAYLSLSDFIPETPVTPDSCGIANETLARTTLRAVTCNDASLVRKLCSYATAINKTNTPGSNEWLYGRAGYLYLLRVARTSFRHDKPITALLQTTFEKTTARILTAPQPWKWYGKAYLGAAHGAIGIITQVVLSAPQAAEKVRPLLSSLLDTQFPSGNFPSSIPADRDELVQFCHGSPGFILCLRSLRLHLPGLERKIDGAIAAAEVDVWEHGLLTKGPCLCHGIAGNALALADNAQFNHFMSYMTDEELVKKDWLNQAYSSDGFAGLYTGEAGRAWAWAVADRGLPRTCLGFNNV